MQVSTEKVGPCKYGMQIEVDADSVRRAFGRAYRDFSEFTRVPGFRPGKAPRSVLEKYVNKERLEQHVMELLAGPAYREAVEQEKLKPYGEPDFEPGDLVETEPWQFRATISVEPVLTLGDPSGIKVERPVLAVSDEDIERSLSALRTEHADHQPVEGRGVAEGDVVVLDMSIRMPDQEEAPVRRSLVSIGQNIPGFDEALMGQMPDETREFDLQFPDDYSEASRAGQVGHFTVTVVTINTRAFPELTDEWIQAIGAGSSLEDFRERERARLAERYEAYSNEVAASRAVAALVERSNVEYPAEMLEEEVNRALHGLSAELERANTTYERYLTMGGMTREEHEERLEKQADQRIRTRLVLREFAQTEQLEITETDTAEAAAHARELAERANMPVGRSAVEQTYEMLNQTLHLRIIQRLKEKIEITDAPVPDVAAPDSEQ